MGVFSAFRKEKHPKLPSKELFKFRKLEDKCQADSLDFKACVGSLEILCSMPPIRKEKGGVPDQEFLIQSGTEGEKPDIRMARLLRMI